MSGVGGVGRGLGTEEAINLPPLSHYRETTSSAGVGRGSTQPSQPQEWWTEPCCLSMLRAV